MDLPSRDGAVEAAATFARDLSTSGREPEQLELAVAVVVELVEGCDQAGVTMTEVVASIRRVTDIMGEISAASSEQSAGVSQVGEAVQQMDQATQQNAALVEQMAAAASSLKTQAQDLVQVVASFKVGEQDIGRAYQDVPRLSA